jgi:hypothetical protein
MSQVKPPRIATWLLNRIVSGNNRESLIGDLIEQYQRRRSRAWYWRQVVMAIVMDTAKQVRDHRLLSVRANVVGFGVLVILQTGVQSGLRNHPFHGAVWIGGHMVEGAQWMALVVWYIWLPMAGAFDGWIVGRLHHAQRSAMVRVFAGCFITWQVLQLCIWMATVDLSNGFSLRLYVFSSFILFVTILVGGLWGVSAGDPNRQLVQ